MYLHMSERESGEMELIHFRKHLKKIIDSRPGDGTLAELKDSSQLTVEDKTLFDSYLGFIHKALQVGVDYVHLEKEARETIKQARTSIDNPETDKNRKVFYAWMGNRFGILLNGLQEMTLKIDRDQTLDDFESELKSFS